MNSSLLSSLRPLLAAPWQQRRNSGGFVGLVVIACIMLVAPIGLMGMALNATIGARDGATGAVMDASMAARQLMASALNVSACIASVLVLGWWALVVSSLLDQNKPVLASLVPRHPARLRAALYVAWAGATAAIVGVVATRSGAPQALLAIVAPTLAFVAVSVRWPMVWMVGVFAPMGMKAAMAWSGQVDVVERLFAQWAAQPNSITVTAIAASIVVLAGLIQSGGRRHIASDSTRRARIARFEARARGAQPVTSGQSGRFEQMLARPYYAWWRHAMARPGTSTFERVMLGLGPGLHWTAGATSVLGTAMVVAAAVVVATILGTFVSWLPHLAGAMCMGAAVAVVPAILSPSLGVQPRLHQTRREQDLLVLLPGVPRGAALSRRLAWQLTGQYVMTWAGAGLVLVMCLAAARAFHFESDRSSLADLARWSVIGMVPVVAFQWRPWARTGAPTSMNALLPLMVAAITIAIIAMLTRVGDWSESTLATAVVAATLAWGVLRWRRMASEPAALPASRLA